MTNNFSLEQANSALAFVRPIMKDIQQLWRELELLRQSESQPESHEFTKRLERIEYFLEELQQVGCIPKDLENGRVDFPCRYKGNPALLCWHLGEDEISHWHGIDDIFDTRRVIDEEFLAHLNSSKASEATSAL